MLPVATAIQRDASYLRTSVEGCSKIRRVLAKSRLTLDEMCCLYGKFAYYLRRVLCKTRLIFPRINGPNTEIIEKRAPSSTVLKRKDKLRFQVYIAGFSDF